MSLFVGNEAGHSPQLGCPRFSSDALAGPHALRHTQGARAREQALADGEARDIQAAVASETTPRAASEITLLGRGRSLEARPHAMMPITIPTLVAGGSWIVDTLVGFLVPDLPAFVHAIVTAPTIAEFWLIAYLLIKGVRTPTPDRLTPEVVDA